MSTSRHAARTAGPRAERRRTLALRLLTTAGLLLVVLTAVGWAAGVKPLVFTSGSMAPAIGTGSLALAQATDPSALEPGDVASIANADGERVTHRVVAVTPQGSESALVLRGDANASNDPQPYVVGKADRVLVSIPVVGRAAAHLDGAAGIVLLSFAGIGLGLVLRRPAGRAHRRPRASSGPPLAVLSAGSLLVCGALVAGSVPTAAYWTDTALARSGTIAAAGPSPTPINATCAEAGSNVQAGWTSVGQRYRYQLTLHRLDNGAQVGDVVYVPAVTTATAASQVTPTTFSPTAVATTGQLNFTVRVQALPSASTSWLSPGALSIPVRYPPDRAALRCGNDTETFVTIEQLGEDSGSSQTDFITNVTSNMLVGTGEPGATVVVRRGGVQVGTATVAANGTWTAPVTLIEGQPTYEAIATDPAGNTSSPATRVIRLDTIAPTVGVTAPCATTGNAVTGVAGATWCRQTSLSWSATFADGGSGLVPLTGSQVRTSAEGAFANYGTGPVSIPEGNGRVVTARATDVAGNITLADGGTFYIDGTAPTISVTYPTNGLSLGLAGLLSNLTAQCGTGNSACGPVTDAVSGTASVQRSLQRTPLLSATGCLNAAGTAYVSGGCETTFQPATVAGSTWRLVASPSTVYSGLVPTFTLRVRATDAAGNVSAVVQVQWTMI